MKRKEQTHMSFYVVTEFDNKNFCIKEKLLIGKKMEGFNFIFKEYPDLGLISLQAWKSFLKNKIIVNEYCVKIPYNYFLNIIKKIPKKKDYTKIKGIVKDGYLFTLENI